MSRFTIRDLLWLTVVVAAIVIVIAVSNYMILMSRQTVLPIKGSVTLNGLPAGFVMLEFHFSDGSRGAALTGEDGTFEVAL